MASPAFPMYIVHFPVSSVNLGTLVIKKENPGF